MEGLDLSPGEASHLEREVGLVLVRHLIGIDRLRPDPGETAHLKWMA